jgi:hypothetical protein
MYGMTTLPLPHQSVRLSTAGFKKLYESTSADPAAAKAIADHIEADPRGALEHVFKLTKAQREAIGNTSDAELRKRAHVLLAELRSEKPRRVHFHPNGRPGDGKPTEGPPYQIRSCTCYIG